MARGMTLEIKKKDNIKLSKWRNFLCFRDRWSWEGFAPNMSFNLKIIKSLFLFAFLAFAVTAKVV